MRMLWINLRVLAKALGCHWGRCSANCPPLPPDPFPSPPLPAACLVVSPPTPQDGVQRTLRVGLGAPVRLVPFHTRGLPPSYFIVAGERGGGAEGWARKGCG